MTDSLSMQDITAAAEEFVGKLGVTNLERFAENLRHVASGSDAMTALQQAVISRLPVAVRDQYAQDGPLQTLELATGVMTQIITAETGWQVGIVDNSSEALEMCPVVAWRVEEDQLVPFARSLSEDGHLSVIPWAGQEGRLVGLMAPGETLDAAWYESAANVAEALRRADDGS